MTAAPIDLTLCLVTDADACRRAGRGVVETALAAVTGGVTCVQVREKGSPRAQLDAVLRLAADLPPRVGLIVNDRVDVLLVASARGARVSGVHVGQGDLPVPAVRELVGPDAVIGLSARTPGELAAGAASGASYVGVGALHDTATKADAPAGLGHERWAALAAAAALPVVAIGGVTAADAGRLRRSGAAGCAVASALCAAADPVAAAAEIRRAWDGAGA